MPKTIIYYHRAYRKITRSGRLFFFEMIAICLPLSIIVLFGYPLITGPMSHIARAVLAPHYPPGIVSVVEKAFLWDNISIVSLPGPYPSSLMVTVNFIISLTMFAFLPKIKKGRNIAIYFFFLAGINLVSSIFFTFSPIGFPYSATDFSEFYVKSEISMWLFIPYVLGMAFLPLPSSSYPKLILIILTLVYSIIFGTLRYIVFLFIVSKFSLIFMALLFFAFGPLIDFVYIVGIYSFYNSRLAMRLKGNDSIWKWSY
jgi:hypothetical protein